MIIAVDFDGTIVENAYPEIGEPMPGAIICIRYLKGKGHTIIINTCRAGKYVEEAIRWLRKYDIPFDFINENDPARVAQYGEDTRKISADVYIDDKNIFCHSINWFDITGEIERMTSKKVV